MKLLGGCQRKAETAECLLRMAPPYQHFKEMNKSSVAVTLLRTTRYTSLLLALALEPCSLKGVQWSTLHGTMGLDYIPAQPSEHVNHLN